MPLVVKDLTFTEASRTHSEIEVKLVNHDTDVTLVLPNGKRVILQWRMEAVSLDICLPEPEMIVTCWEGDDMKSAKPYMPPNMADPALNYFSDGHVRKCGQLVIHFGPKYLNEKE
jgi:hypothetical protein